jgi:hypothetical protein
MLEYVGYLVRMIHRRRYWKVSRGEEEKWEDLD